MIKLDSLDFKYTGQQPLIFSNFNWSVEKGEAWAVIGPSGCGKSTLLYLLNGILKPSAGEIWIDDELLTDTRPRTGLILQDYGLLPWATIQQNASLGLDIRSFYGPDGKHAPFDVSIDENSRLGEYWVDRLGLSQIANQFPSQVSGGQRQRTAIARTLALNPDLLLMDEPFASLDAPTRENLQQLVLELRAEKQLTTIIVTHTIEEAAILGHKIMILKQSRNSQPMIIENPSASENNYFQSPTYYEMCDILHKAIV
jgi:ABC-type nitrate/sulfonate/bicarbonate transport system ATPase subunit